LAATSPSYTRGGVLARATRREQVSSPATSKAQGQLASRHLRSRIKFLGGGISRAPGWSRVVGMRLGVTIHGKTTPISFTFPPSVV
jgi:hypothetical protein